MIARGGVLLGTCLLAGASIPVNAKAVKIGNTDPVDVRKFGASGKRADNATKAFRDALEVAASRGAEL